MLFNALQQYHYNVTVATNMIVPRPCLSPSMPAVSQAQPDLLKCHVKAIVVTVAVT